MGQHMCLYPNKCVLAFVTLSPKILHSAPKLVFVLLVSKLVAKGLPARGWTVVIGSPQFMLKNTGNLYME